MYNMNNHNDPRMQNTRVVGNEFANDDSFQYKQDVRRTLESFNAAGNMMGNLMNLYGDQTSRNQLIGELTALESSTVLSDPVAMQSPFFSNYADRLEQLAENTLNQIARESLLASYQPIEAYAPLFLKKRWVDCVYDAALMAEIPTSPILNFGYEFRYIVDPATGAEYRMPDVHFNDELMEQLWDAATGLNIDRNVAITMPMAAEVSLLSDTYVPGFVPSYGNKLNQDLGICKVKALYKGAEVEISKVVKVDMMFNGFPNAVFTYHEQDAEGNIVRSVSDTIHGKVNFDAGTIHLSSVNGADDSADVAGEEKLYITEVYLCGKLSNINNERSLDVRRKVERIQHVMPESGPRFNTSIRIEEVQDAMSAGNIDLIADQTDMMGRCLAEFSDFDVRRFLKSSFEMQEAAAAGPFGYEKCVFRAGFDAVPYQGYVNNVSNYLTDLPLYFDKLLIELGNVVKEEQVMFVAICHPSLMRELNSDVRWITQNQGTEIGGIRLKYDYGIKNTLGTTVHFITTFYAKPEEGIRVIMLPMRNDLITFKRYIYSVAIDKGYRNNWAPLTPNIMATQRTSTFEVLPIQGLFEVAQIPMFSPQSLDRAHVDEVRPVKPSWQV